MTDDTEQQGFQLLLQAIKVEETHASEAITEPARTRDQLPPNDHDHGNASYNSSRHPTLEVGRAKRCAPDAHHHPVKRRRKNEKRSKRPKKDRPSHHGKEDRKIRRRHRRYAKLRKRWALANPVADDFRTDWSLPTGPDGKPPRIMASPARVPDSMDDPPPEPEYQPEGLYKLSAEVRLEIFRELLVTHQPIGVYGGWRLVYRRPATRTRPGHDGPGLSTAILRTCKLFFAEARTVLYGENLFHYRLYDSSSHRPRFFGRGDDADYADDAEAARACRRRCTCFGSTVRGRRKKTTVKCDINVEKYRHLFRRIAVEADYNRHSQTIMMAMANALKTFVHRPSRQPLNIHKLIVRVAPRRYGPNDHDDDDDNELPPPRFTFVNFFAPGSPVLVAIKNVWCRFLHVDLMANYAEGSVERRGFRMVLDRRVEMLANRLSDPAKDIWHGDTLMRRMRSRKIEIDRQRLEKIGERVGTFCDANVKQTVGR